MIEYIFRNKISLSLFLFLIIIFVGKINVPAENIDSTFLPNLNSRSRVNTVAQQSDGKFIVAGEFNSVSTSHQNGIARLSNLGTIDPTFNSGTGANGPIYVVAFQPDGKILIGGDFTFFNGQSKNKLIRLNTDGSIDQTFNVGQGYGTVYSLKIQADGKILVGGNTSKLVTRINENGSIDNTFTSNTNPFSGVVSTIIIQPDNKILVGGSFSDYNTTTSSFVRLNNNGTIDSSFTARISGSVAGCLINSDGKLTIVGALNRVNNQILGNIARLNSDGSIDNTFQTSTNGFNDYITSIISQGDGKIIVGGFFTAYEGNPQNRIARLNNNGSLDTSFVINDGFDNTVKGLALNDDKIIAVGFFTSVNSSERFGIAQLNNSGQLTENFKAGAGSHTDIYIIKPLPDGKILVGGKFEMVNGLPKIGLARLNSDGSLDETFSAATKFNEAVRTIAVQADGKIIVGGSFYQVNGLVRYVVRLNSDGSLDNTFNAPISSDTVYKIIALNNGKILVAGSLETVGATSRQNITQLNADGSIDTSFNPGTGFNAPIFDIEVQSNGQIIACGVFSNFNGVSRVGIARINGNGSLDSTFNVVNIGTNVFDILIQDNGQILIGGSFTTVNGVSRNAIARINADSTLDNTFNSPLSSSSGVSKISINSNGKIMIVGYLNVPSGNQRNVVQLNPNGSINPSIFTAVGGVISEVVSLPEGKAIIGGRITSKPITSNGNYIWFSIVKFIPQEVKADFDGDGKSDIGIFRPSGGQWWISASSTNVTTAAAFGSASDKIVPGDFTGDGKTDMAFWRPSNGTWYILRSEDFSFYGFPFGASGDVPVSADFDGDGKADPAVFRASTSSWYIQKSSGGIESLTFGTVGDAPVVADYDGDGRADIAITRINNGTREWWIRRSSDGQVFSAAFGNDTDKAVQGDYTGDGKADIAFWRPSNGFWYIIRSEDFSFYGFPFGSSGDTPAPGDYDGDGKADAAVFRNSNASWYLQRSTSGFIGLQFGASGDSPVPSAYVP